MENNFNPASQKQIELLQKLGYKGSYEGLTKAEASAFINDLQGQGNNTYQAPQNNYYQAPQQQQYNNYQNQNYGTYQQAPQQQKNDIAVVKNDVFITRTGEELQLSKEIVNAYITNEGNPLTDTEYNYFFSVCKTYGLNPFLKDIYAIKFGTQPATFVIDYKVMQMAAENHPSFDGIKTGVLLIDSKGQLVEREGAYLLPNETLIGGWCDVYRKDRTHTNRTYALYEENVKRDKTGKINAQWAGKPTFMIVKVAKAQAFRETFPNLFSSNTYTADENLGDENNAALERKENSIKADIKFTDIDNVKKNQKSKMASVQPTIDENGVVDADIFEQNI